MLLIEEMHPDTVSPEDLRRLAEVHVAAITQLCAAHYGAEQMRAWTGGPGDFGEAVRSSAYFCVVREASLIAGFGSLRRDGSVRHVYVHPDFARRGLGSKLLAELERQLVQRRLGKAVLESSLNAVEFYKRNGYAETGRSMVRMGDVSIDVVKMEKALEGNE